MLVRLFGDTAVDGTELPPRERTILALLMLTPGATTPREVLAEAVWGGRRPATSDKQVQIAVNRLRDKIGRDVITTVGPGYAVDNRHVDSDIRRFASLVERAREARLTGQPERAVGLLSHALELWRGEPYRDLADWPDAAPEIARLTELRSEAEEALLSARLAAGDPGVADAERLVRQAPMREERWALLALALYRAGRQAEALSAIRRARSTLADEGIDVGASLRALEVDILNQADHLTGSSAAPSSRCPYPGLLSFDERDAADFFGREPEIADAIERLDAGPFLAVAGASGSGKSSLVRAGLVPQLRQRGVTVRITTPGDLSGPVVAAESADILVVDQFEELFAAPPAHASSVAASLAERVSRGRAVVLCVRSDMLDRCAADASIGPLCNDGVFLIGPLPPERLRAAIEQPARVNGLRLEPGLVELVLRDAERVSGVLPHLSHALAETWRRRSGALLTVEGYEAAGGIAGAIAQSAEELYRAMGPEERERCRALLLRLVEVGAEGAPTRRRMPRSVVRDDGDLAAVLVKLADARLVTADDRTVEVAHEAMATAWPRLSAWLEEDAEGARTLAAVSTAAAVWDADGRPDEDLLRGSRLATAQEWRTRTRPHLTAAEGDFLDASTARERAVLDAEERTRRRERRQRRRLAVALAAAAVLLVGAVAAGGAALAQGDRAARSAEEATIAAVTAESLALRATDRDVAALLAVEAHRRWPDDPRTRGALIGTLTSAGGFLGNAPVADADRVAGDHIPGTREALVVVDDAGLAVHDIDDGSRLRPIEFTGGSGYDALRPIVRVSGDGTTALVLRFRLADDERIHTEATVVDLVGSVVQAGPVVTPRRLGWPAVTDDGSRAITVDEGGAVVELDLRALATAEISPGEPEDPATVAGVVGGRVVAAAAGELRILGSSGTAVEVEVPPGHAGSALADAGEGRAVTAGERGVIAVDVASGALLWSQEWARSDDGHCAWLAAAPTRGTFYCGGESGSIEERRMVDGAVTGRTLEPQGGAVGDLRVASDESELVIIGAETPTIGIWRLDGSGPAARLIAAGHFIDGGYSPDGGRLLVTRQEPDPGVFQHVVWDPDADAPLDRIDHDPDGGADWASSNVVSSRFGGELRLYDLETRSVIDSPALPEGAFTVVAGRGEHAFAIARPGSVTPLDPETGRPTGPELEPAGQILGTSDDPSAGRLAVIAVNAERTDTVITLYDTSTWEVVRRGLEGQTGAVVIPETGQLISSGPSSLRRSSLDTFEPLGILPRTRAQSFRLQVDAEGRTLMVVSFDQHVAVYDAASGIRLGDRIPADATYSLPGSLDPDGTAFAINVPDGVVEYSLEPEVQVDAACRLAGRDFTDAEWARYFPSDGAPRTTCDRE
jgi:DNA-binding SARP family transcriptional activator